MNSQYADYMQSGIPGFSSQLAHAISAANGGHRDQKSSSGTDRERGNNNRNLSAVIARIRDDGPADALADDTVTWSGAGRAQKPAPNTTPLAPAAGSADKAVKARVDAGADEDRTTSPAHDSGGSLLRADSVTTKKSAWRQFAMLFALAGVGGMCFYLYTLVDQVDDIIRNLRPQGDDIRMTATTEQQSNAILPLVSGLNDELKSLKSELRVIRDDYRNTENRLSTRIPDDLSDQLMKIRTAAANDGALQENLVRIQREMAEMKKVIESVKTGMVTNVPSTGRTGDVAHATAPTKASVNPQPVAGAWIVNLASLSSRDKALQAVARLKATGVAPMIQEAVVNGEQVYRLSVAGFYNRDDAKAFIKKARREFGFDGAWIRHG
jgi:cell division septation protein DedD